MFHALLLFMQRWRYQAACLALIHTGPCLRLRASQTRNPGLGVSTQTRAGCPARTERKSGSPTMCQIMPASGSLTLPWSRLPAGTRDLASGNSNLAEMFFYFFCASRI